MQIIREKITFNNCPTGFIHTDLQNGSWYELSFVNQMARIGDDIEKTIHLRNNGAMDQASESLRSALELFHHTVADPKNKKHLKELCRTRGFLLDYFVCDNEYSSTDEIWQEYFLNYK